MDLVGAREGKLVLGIPYGGLEDIRHTAFGLADCRVVVSQPL